MNRSRTSSRRSNRRVVVTGIGTLTSNANSTTEYTAALREGRSGIGEIRRFDSGFPDSRAGEVDFEDASLGLDRVSQLAVTAAREALADSGLEPEGAWRQRASVCMGTSRGPALSLEGLCRLSEAEERMALLAEVPFYSIARNVAAAVGAGGSTPTVTMACVSSSLAIGWIIDAVRRGEAEVGLAGGADALTPLSYSGFSVLRAMTKSVCRPFDRHRDGMVLGEGAGVLVIEEREHALARGAKIHAELLGWGSAGDAHHPTRPHPEGQGLANAMRRALRHAGREPEAIDHLNLHGTGTRANDSAECRAVRTVFGERRTSVPTNSLKPLIGHTLGGAGVLELAGSLLAMEEGFIPATLNHQEPDPECDLDIVSGAPREVPVSVLMSTKSAFGGANVAIVAGRA